MSLLMLDTFFDLKTVGLHEPKGFRDKVRISTTEILDIIGKDSYINYKIEKSNKKRGHFTLSINAKTPGNTLVVSKSGKKLYTLLQKSKKLLIKSFHRQKNKRKTYRKRQRNDFLESTPLLTG